MKKVLATITVCLMMLALMTGCSSSNTPKAVVEKATKCMLAKDYKGLAQLFDMPESDAEQFGEMMETKAEMSVEQKGEVKSYEIIDETIDEEKDEAVVTLKTIYADGNESTQKIPLKKNESGEWKLVMDK